MAGPGRKRTGGFGMPYGGKQTFVLGSCPLQVMTQRGSSPYARATADDTPSRSSFRYDRILPTSVRNCCKNGLDGSRRYPCNPVLMDPQIVDRIYECSFVPELWRGVLGGLPPNSEARAGVLFVSPSAIHDPAA